VTDTLRDRIAMTLLEHRFVITGCTDQPMCCACQEGCSDAQGHMLAMDPLLHDDHIADAILALPGIAVVELPEPAGAVRRWPALVGGEPESVYRAGDEVVVSGGLRLYVDEARDIAAALLACSVKRNGKDGKQSASPTFSPKPNSDARRKAATSERT
jgi:hypothetical protein